MSRQKEPPIIGKSAVELYAPWSIAIQGQPGSFSHQAATDMFPNFEGGANLHCFDDFEAPFKAVKDEDVDIAVIPVENTLAGTVPYVFNAFRDSGLSIIGEYFLGVQFHLLLRPEANTLDVREVYSHMHALAQCKGYLDSHPQWKSVRHADTAGAAKMVSEQDDPSVASISSAFAAHMYGLKIADQSVQDAKNPLTRFLVFRKGEVIPDITEIEGSLPRHKFVSNMYLKPLRRVERPVTEILKAFEEIMPDRAEPLLEKYKGDNLRHEGYFAEFMGHRSERAMRRLEQRLYAVCSEVEFLGSYYSHYYHRLPRRAGLQTGPGEYHFG